MTSELTNLDDETLLKRTQELVSKERETTTAILRHLREVERRRLYAARGFPSLFEYCVKGLGYSESAAYRRIASMRLLRELPAVEEKLRAGRISLSVVAQAQAFFKQENRVAQSAHSAQSARFMPSDRKLEIMGLLEGKSTREAEKQLLALSSCPISISSERVRPVSAGHSELRIMLSNESLQDLESLKALLAHSHPDLSWGELVGLIAKMALEKLMPRTLPTSKAAPAPKALPAPKAAPAPKALPTPKAAPAPRALPAPKAAPAPRALPAPEAESVSHNRHIPVAVRRQVYWRDRGRCTFKDLKTGRECRSRFAIEIDHVRPFAMGGTHTPGNLRLLCRAHNQRYAIESFGLRKIERMISR